MSDKKWLIKNNGHILGPLTTEEVIQEWNKGFFSPFATALLPGQACWLFITNYKEFSKLKRSSETETDGSFSTQSVTHSTAQTSPTGKVTGSPPSLGEQKPPPSSEKVSAARSPGSGGFKKPPSKRGGPLLREKLLSRKRRGGEWSLLLYGGGVVLLLVVLWMVF